MLWLIERFKTAGDTCAFIHNDRKVAYADIEKKVKDFSKHIQDSGVASGETVVVLGDYSPEVFCFILALALNRNIIVPLTRESVIEQKVALNVSGCHWLAQFDAPGVHVTIKKEYVPVESKLLTDFIRTGAAGIILFSSGSSGTPKGILHNFEKVAEKFLKQRQPVVAIPFLMIDHFGGINTILAITASLGTVVTVADRSVASICNAIATYKVELLPVTPSFLNMLIMSQAYREYDLSSLKRISYGTEVMPQSTLDKIREIFPNAQLLQTYGLSEVGVLRSQSRDDGSLWVRIGGEGFQTKVKDDILWIKSDYAMVGYLNAPSEFDEEGWFNTKDRVEVDGEYFRILGRVTDIINVGGQKVYPTEIENVILTLDNIKDVAVYGEPHAMLGQIVVAKVQLHSDEPADSLKKRIRSACMAKLAAYKAPSKVVVSQEELYTVRQKKSRKA